MSAPQRIQRKRTRGWRMPEGAVYVGRPTAWGNPFAIGAAFRVGITSGPMSVAEVEITPPIAVALYEAALTQDTGTGLSVQVGLHIEELRGHDLCCWCAPSEPCHADVLLKLANGSRAVSVPTPGDTA